jgi:PAS domain S-box-containing protein
MKSPALHKKPKISDDPAELRRRAELRLSGHQTKAALNQTDANNERQLHELEVHQIELEMQNEELKEARDKLEALLEIYTDLYDFAPVGYLTLDREGAIGEANLAGASLLGIARSALVKQRLGLFVSPADRSVFDAFLKKVFESGAREECDASLLLKGKHPVDVRMRAIVFESGQACRVAVSDITAHKLAEAATARLAAIVNSSSDAIIGKDLNSIVTSWNAGAEKIFGYSASEMVGCPISLLLPSDRQQEVEQIMSRIKQGENVEHFETLRVAKDGRLLDMSVAVSPIRYAAGKIAGAATVARDITERKRAEADRLILNKLESTGILAGGMAHDFNNLLTVILLNLELAQMLNPPGAELVDRLETAKKTALMARSLTAQFVTFAEGGAPIRKPASLSGLIQESVRPALSGSNVRCEFSLAEDLWVAEVDAGQIGQVIRGMVLNAREAMPQGGVVSVRAENAVLGSQEQPSLPPGEYVRVSIADRGVGISKEVLPKIFDPYFSTKERGDQKGMGLGLTICHAVVQKHQGAIAVESEVGVGTTFHIYLPAARKLSGVEKASVPAGVPRQGRVLVMDDEEAVRRVVGLTLWGMGHEVELAEDGQRAVEVYKKAKSLGRHFDVVILDLTVRGGMGGQETIQVLLKLDPTVKAIAMSGHVHDPVILEPERHGFKGALPKPFDVGKLQEILSRVMGSSPGSQAAP